MTDSDKTTSLDKIRGAEQRVGDLQESLAAVQVGLERAEAIALAAEEAKRRAEQLLIVSVCLVGLSILVALVSRRKPRA